MTEVINKSDLIQDVSARCDYISETEVDDAVRTLSIALVTPILGIAVDGLAAELLQHGPASENLSR